MDKCPFCGAKIYKEGNTWDFYECGTTKYKRTGEFDMGRSCAMRQIANLKERLEEEKIRRMETVALCSYEHERLEAWREYGRHQSFYMDEAYSDEEKESIKKLKDLGEI